MSKKLTFSHNARVAATGEFSIFVLFIAFPSLRDQLVISIATACGVGSAHGSVEW